MPRRYRTGIIAIVMLLLVMGGAILAPVRTVEVSLVAEPLFSVFGVPVTNTMLSSWMATIVLVLLCWLATRSMREVPGRLQNLLEWVLEIWLNLAESVVGKTNARLYFPLVVTIFLLILVSNWMGLLPGFGTIGVWANEGGKTVLVPFFRSPNTDLNNTIALALVSVLVTQYFGVRAVGFFRYASRFVDLRHGPIGLVVGFLELVGEVARIISFSFRLFGNIFAGEVLLAVLAFLVPWVVELPFLGLELFVGFIQAFIFAMLTLVFLSVATAAHGDSQGESHEAEARA